MTFIRMLMASCCLLLAWPLQSAAGTDKRVRQKAEKIWVLPGALYMDVAHKLRIQVIIRPNKRFKAEGVIPSLPDKITLYATGGQSADQIAMPAHRRLMNQFAGRLRSLSRPLWTTEGLEHAATYSRTAWKGKDGWWNLSMLALGDKRNIDTIVAFELDRLQLSKDYSEADAKRMVAQSIRRQADAEQINPRKVDYWRQIADKLDPQPAR
jgi:hypothetical protein